jgi:hypothetical protein
MTLTVQAAFNMKQQRPIRYILKLCEAQVTASALDWNNRRCPRGTYKKAKVDLRMILWLFCYPLKLRII